MANRVINRSRNIEGLQRLAIAYTGIVDLSAVIAYVMINCGATQREAGDVLGVSHQWAGKLSKAVEDSLK